MSPWLGLLFLAVAPSAGAAETPRAVAAPVVAAAAADSVSGTDRLWPRPRQISLRSGALRLGARLAVRLEGPADPRPQRGVARLVKRLETLLGRSLPLCFEPCGPQAPGAFGAPPESRLRLQWQSPGLAVQSLDESEHYTLEVTPAEATLLADNPLGLLHGLETLAQWAEVEPTTQPAVAGKAALKTLLWPGVIVDDAPHFAWRGVMLDTARHVFAPQTLRRLLAAMAASKLNVLHWHLSDDQRFALESRAFPKLHTRASSGAYYRQSEVTELVALARDLGIRVVPEFDMPGHVSSWLLGYPELGARSALGPAPGPVDRWGIFDAALDPSRPETYTFVGNLLAEAATLFPDPFVHVGGDEVTGKHWQKNPKIRAYMQLHGHTNSKALQAAFGSQVASQLSERGKGGDGLGRNGRGQAAF